MADPASRQPHHPVPDEIVLSTPAACTLIDAALTVRRGLRELPKHDRPLIARLVA